MAQKSVAIIGTGTIGASWISLFLAKGYRVVASDPAATAEGKARAYVLNALKTLHTDSRTNYNELITENLSFVSEAHLKKHLQTVDFVQENGPERLEYKRSIFDFLDRHTRSSTVLASSSSGMPASTFCGACRSPERVLIGHPFNPPHLIPLVEVVPHPATSPSAIHVAISTYREVGRQPVVLRQETPGFVVNRLQAALVHEAYSLVARDIISAKDLGQHTFHPDLYRLCKAQGLLFRFDGQRVLSTSMGDTGAILDKGIIGFKHAVAHTGPANAMWMEDMHANRFEYTTPNVNKLFTSVQEELDDIGSPDLEGIRNRFLVEVQDLKARLGQQPEINAP